MQQFNVGPDRVLKTGIDYASLAGKKQLQGDNSMWQDVQIFVDPGTYNKPVVYESDTWPLPKVVNNLTLDGTGNQGAKARIVNRLPVGMPSIKGMPFTGTASDKGLIWFAGMNTLIRGFEIEGAKTQSGSNNGAGVRVDRGANLTLELMIFRYCQNGVLVSPPTEDGADLGKLIIRNSEFSCCGFGGQAHLIYCGLIESCFAEDTVFTTAQGQGNTFKTRAKDNTLRNCFLSTGSGYNSWIYDSMGGKNLLRGCTFQNLPGYSSQPKGCIHIYIEPKSAECFIDIQNCFFDLRGKVQGKPILVDPRVKYEGTGSVGEDGKFHRLGENYYIPGEFRPMTGIVDNNIFLINADQRDHFGYDPATGRNRAVWPWTDAKYGPIPMPPGLVEGPNNVFVVAAPSGGSTQSAGEGDEECAEGEGDNENSGTNGDAG